MPVATKSWPFTVSGNTVPVFEYSATPIAASLSWWSSWACQPSKQIQTASAPTARNARLRGMLGLMALNDGGDMLLLAMST
eukprot:CAMPEP_0115142040 /NCGR_PEP_ID=MMETSP0227-20121206/59915_1 /TAXON_ID=89957 /ORGANISM="Polarella glacialis, Strain CCMP 1383" /LENGTH=80 /DNA_ID=CAMNT_0002550555 /DNA_START=176 /DNA_END=414 /DNA_ORIENTATION=-